MSHRSLVSLVAVWLPLLAPFVPIAALAQVPLAPSSFPPAVVPAPPAPTGVQISVSTLRLLLARGILSPAEYASAGRDIGDTSGNRTGDATTIVVGRFAATVYGFVEGCDAIWDSTQSFSDVAGNAQVAVPTSYAGSHAREQLGVRNSRFGIRLKAPETAYLQRHRRARDGHRGRGATHRAGPDLLRPGGGVLQQPHLPRSARVPLKLQTPSSTCS